LSIEKVQGTIMQDRSDTSILVVDDDPRLIGALRRTLAYEGYHVATATNGEDALSQARRRTHDLIILDRLLPDMDGLMVCRRLREEDQHSTILMLTARDTIADRVEGLEVGADDYLVKPFALEELLARVRVLLRRAQAQAAAEPPVLRFEDLELDMASREAKRGPRAIQLSTKEFQLLSLFMRHPRQVLTRDTIMDQVWGYDYSGESNVLEVYVGYLRSKLEAGGEPRLIYTVRGAGYVLRAPVAEAVGAKGR
jgi:two-component system, OmpR family, response regulator MprA